MTDRLVIGLDKLNNKLKILLEENKRIRQQHESLQEENRETLRINSELKETLQENDQRFEEFQRNLEKQRLEESKRFERQHTKLQEENRETLSINSELKVKLQERDEQLEKLQQQVLNFEKQKIEIQVISQNIEKTLEMLELDEIDENNKFLKEKNKPLISESSEQKNSINYETTDFPLSDNYSFQLSENVENSWSFFDNGCIKVVVGLDFGITYSGFAYCHISDSHIISNYDWPGSFGEPKTNTVLQYDDEYINVMSWGAPALFKRLPFKKKIGKDNETKPVELFKLHLSNLPDELKPKLPVRYEKAITDYLREIGKVIKETIASHWIGIDILHQVLLVLTYPADYSDKSKAIMRECAFNAGLVRDKDSMALQCITESEAAAIYCIFGEHDLKKLGTTFMVVDCGDTVNLTTCKLISETRVDVVTERSESIVIDDEFVKCLRKILGDRPIDLLRENYNGQMQYLIKDFSRRYKYSFTGEDDFDAYKLDLEDVAPAIMQYIIDNNIRKWLEEAEWVVKFKIRSIFDPFIENVIQLIHTELDSSREKCSSMFLIGSFSESKYLQNSIKKEFQHRINISIPTQPTVAVAHGAVKYGLNLLFNDTLKI
ncbi:16034_t:CDS:2 [Funneliformis mosseae]|uniref:16034_t:CDS:1 n=1 Tax=Funneliformis mosseae TaxID=27381 RepID=A0A9N9GCB6_FUNMO|nr:16034_t:CDS:2 [Funneliformis mosseae]